MGQYTYPLIRFEIIRGVAVGHIQRYLLLWFSSKQYFQQETH